MIMIRPLHKSDRHKQWSRHRPAECHAQELLTELRTVTQCMLHTAEGEGEGEAEGEGEGENQHHVKQQCNMRTQQITLPRRRALQCHN